MQNVFRFFENMMAAVAFAEANERETAIRIAFPDENQEKRPEETQQVQEENRPVLYS